MFVDVIYASNETLLPQMKDQMLYRECLGEI